MTPPEDRSGDGPDDALGDARAAIAEARAALRRAEEAVDEVAREGSGGPAEVRVDGPEWTWRERLWAAPAETRVGAREVAEALDVSTSWVYQRTRQDAESRLPHRKMGGSLVFVVGEVRHWVRENEEAPVQGPMYSPGPGGLGVVEGGSS